MSEDTSLSADSARLSYLQMSTIWNYLDISQTIINSIYAFCKELIASKCYLNLIDSLNGARFSDEN